MKCGNYYKVVGLSIDALETQIVQDKNIKDINDAQKVINETKNCDDIVWLVLPCQYKIE